jgi:hypothetical protein
MFTSAVSKRVVRNTIFRKAPPSVVSGYGKLSINLILSIEFYPCYETVYIAIM